MSRLISLIDQRFGRLLVLNRQPNKGNSTMWLCNCVCGKNVVVYGINLKRGLTKSCGCLHKEAIKEACGTHGMVDTPEYNSWTAIKSRCYNPKNPKYKNYGARGITMSDEWKNDFMAFYNDMGPRPSPEHSIDRKDNDKGYYKDNCRWATGREQNNNRRNNLLYEFDGAWKSLAEWCRVLEMNYHTVYQRIYRYGMSFEEAIVTTAVDK